MNGSQRSSGHDAVASLAIVLVALIALAGSGFLPWWAMKARAPQYGQRVLVVEVNPRRVSGDVFEMDALGHYVGIRPLNELAPVERTLAPFGLAAAAIGLVAAPWLRQRWLRALAVLPAVAMPVAFLADLRYWMERSTSERDPSAALNLTITTIDTKLFGAYELGQFKIEAAAMGGLYVAGLAGLLGLGLIFAAPLPAPAPAARLWSRRRRTATSAAVAGFTGVVCCSGAASAKGSSAHGDEGAAAGAGGPVRAEAALSTEAGPTGPLATAVAAAREGDTVEVPAGVHREKLVLDKRVRLVGGPGAILDGQGRGTVLRVRAAGVRIEGITVRNSGASYATEDAGIRIEGASDVHVENVRVEDTLFGIFAAQADRCRIERTTVIGKDLPHVRRGDGVRLWYSSGCVLRGNLVERSRDVIVWYSQGTVVEDNVVRTSRYGLHYMYSDRNAFRRNRFEDNQVGAAIMYSHGVELSENSFSFSNGVAAYGLLVKDADDVFVVGNRFVGNATALFFDGAPQSKDGRATIHRNLLARNDVGLALQPLCKRIRIWENAFLGNRIQVQVQGTGTAEGNEWSVGGRGNYWSEAVVYDADGDGVSDHPYRLESTYEALADRYPVLAFFQGTAGAEAIDGAARLFPVFAPRPRLIDPHPLVRPALTAWTRGDEEAPGDRGLAGLGAALLALGAATAGIARRAA